MTKKVKLLCVGIGGYAAVYLDALLAKEDPDFEIVGMVEVAPERCKHFAILQAAGVPLFATMEEFYANHTADLAIITTPIFLHTRQVLCALENGSHVMVEKPLSGVSADEAILNEAAEKAGKFVMVGYQWSYAPAINALKMDITNGVYGKPQFLKTLVLWPRPQEYFTRGTGWGGKRTAPDGTVMNDSVINNATAHYLHNMLYVTGGAHGRAAEAVTTECDLSRVNAIENFDTAAARFTLDNGATALCLVSHATEKLQDPLFSYRFENGTVTYDGTEIIGVTVSGEERRYGNPAADVNEKIFEAIAAVRKADYIPPCGVSTAAAQVRCIEAVQQHPIHPVKAEKIGQNGNFLFAEGLYERMMQCYAEECLLSELPAYRELVD